MPSKSGHVFVFYKRLFQLCVLEGVTFLNVFRLLHL